jgi:hypothetical protein
MILSDQAIDIHRPQFDLIPHRLAQPRRADICCIRSWLPLFRQLAK